MEEETHVSEEFETVSNIRHDIVATAARFLRNPRVARRSAADREAFLRRKGLSNAEVAAAFERTGQSRTNRNDRAVEQYSKVRVSGYRRGWISPAYTSKWFLVRDICNAIVLLAGATYGIHCLFKRYVWPYLHGRARRRSLEDSIDELNENMRRMAADLNTTVQSLTTAFDQLSQQSDNNVAVQKLREEIDSLKGLILNGRQFPSLPSAGLPSIPSWQLSSSSEKNGSDIFNSSCSSQARHSQAASMSSSPEIISVEDAPANQSNYFSW